MTQLASPDWLVTDAELQLLKDLRFCNLGEGRISRIERGGAKRALVAAWKSSYQNQLKVDGVTASWLDTTTDHVRVEHLARKHFSMQIAVGSLAEELPDSATTLTMYVISTPEQEKALRAFIVDRVGTGPADLMSANHPGYRSRLTMADRYLAEALF